MDIMKSDEMLTGSRILVIEDEVALAKGLAFNLEAEGYIVTLVHDGNEGVNKFRQGQWDLILLDIMLPHKNGFDVARIIRDEAPRLPLLILTARTGLEDRLHGLSLGADDYLTKPFHLPELILRIQIILRRAHWYESVMTDAPQMTLGPWRIDFTTLTARNGRKQLPLSALEAQVLRYFLMHPDRIIPRSELLEKVWQTRPDLETRTVDNFVLRLRKHFEPDPAHPRYFHAIRGAGYRLELSSESGGSAEQALE